MSVKKRNRGGGRGGHLHLLFLLNSWLSVLFRFFSPLLFFFFFSSRHLVFWPTPSVQKKMPGLSVHFCCRLI